MVVFFYKRTNSIVHCKINAYRNKTAFIFVTLSPFRVKTLVMEDEAAKPMIVLMHGDCKVSVKELARQVGCKKIEPCKPEVANRHTGFLVGGTSPFGTKKKMPVYAEKSILDLPLIYINGGRRGFLVGVHPHDLLRVLSPVLVSVALKA